MPAHFKKFKLIMEINGVPVYAHWSVLLVWAVILLGALEKPAETLTAWSTYFGVLLIHECGHMIVAQRMGYEVSSIVLYPIHGRACLQQPWSRYDHAVIAWGGVLAQALVGVPLVAWASLIGFTRWVPVNVAIGILGYFSLMIAAFNLIPIPQFDGAIAWYIFPELMQRMRKPQAKRKVGWRGW